MSREIKADKWSPASGTSATIGDSGDTYTVPSGVTLNTSSATLTLPSSVITGQTAKTSLVDADKFLISDSAASGALKYVEKQYLPSGGLVLLQTVTASTSSTVDFEGNFSSTYDNYIIYFNNVRMSDAPGYFGVRIKTPAGGGSYWSASNNYARVSIARRITGDGTSNDESSGDSQYNRIPLTISNLENNGDWDIRGYVNIPYPLTSSYKYIEFMTLAGCPDDSALMTYCTGAGNLYKNDNLTGIQFLGETGTVSSGTFKLYGIVK